MQHYLNKRQESKKKVLCRGVWLSTVRLYWCVFTQTCKDLAILDFELLDRNHRYCWNNLNANMRSKVWPKTKMSAVTYFLVSLRARKLCVHRCMGGRRVYELFLGFSLVKVRYFFVFVVGAIAICRASIRAA